MHTWPNYHSHTHYCDGAKPPRDYIEEALRLGLPAYGYSSHAPVAFEAVWSIPDLRFNDYLAETRAIQKEYEGRIEVYVGLEVDFIPGIAGRSRHLVKDAALDYFIGSVHFVDSFKDGTPWTIDASFELFDKGLREIFFGNFQKAATRFYELTREMIETDRPDVIGHLDKIKMFNANSIYVSGNEKWYRDQVQLTVDTLRKHGGIVEINTRGYYKYNQLDLYPSDWIVKMLKRADVPMMINSDSHHPDEITMGMDFAARMLKQAGVSELYALRNRKWQAFTLVTD